jgi:hypothetical protein
MNIEWAFLARSCALVGGLLVVEEPGVDRLVVPRFPARLALPLLLNVRGMPDEFEGDHELEAYLFGPDTVVVDDLSGTITLPGPPPDHDPRWALSETLLLVPRFNAKRAGGYGFDVRLDGKTGRLVPFVLVEEHA